MPNIRDTVSGRQPDQRLCRDAVAWAAEAGLLTGVSQDTLLPQGTATRAQTAAVLTRFCTNPAH